MPPAPNTSEMLAQMSACAYRLGMAFADEAERTEDRGERLELFGLFDRCFFAVRVATALQLRLRREAARAPEDETTSDAPERERPERAERDRERLDTDRDRETERASVPLFLNTLRGVAADAAALPRGRPAELPTLQDLLATATAPQVAVSSTVIPQSRAAAYAGPFAPDPARRASAPPHLTPDPRRRSSRSWPPPKPG